MSCNSKSLPPGQKMNPFDLKAAEWDDHSGRVENTRKIAAAIKQAVPLSKTRFAMEFGCGTGLVSRELLPLIVCPEQGRRGRILAIDLSPGMIAQLQNRIAEAGLQKTSPRNASTSSPPRPPGA
jgi:ubiquinone/menaquinone biosynthesis C-methylase UbiE